MPHDEENRQGLPLSVGTCARKRYHLDLSGERWAGGEWGRGGSSGGGETHRTNLTSGPVRMNSLQEGVRGKGTVDRVVKAEAFEK